jgi:ComF family protein
MPGPIRTLAAYVQSAVKRTSAGLFSLVFPDNCRICEAPLTRVSRVPVCDACLLSPEPSTAEHYCVSCHTPFLNDRPLDGDGRCRLCRRGLSGFDAAFAFGDYDGVLRKLVQLFKYGKIPTLSAPLGAMLARALPRERAFDAIVAMPMHWRRRWQRGFNQSALLAEELARRTGLPVLAAVRRKKGTPPQAGLTAAQRRANVSGAFEIRKAGVVRGKRIVLVDDVFTTGATAAACARALKRAGAAHVAVLTVARADRRLSAVPMGSLPYAQSGSAA